MKRSIELQVVIQSLGAKSRQANTHFDTEDARWIRESIAENYWDALLAAKSGRGRVVSANAAGSPSRRDERVSDQAEA